MSGTRPETVEEEGFTVPIQGLITTEMDLEVQTLCKEEGRSRSSLTRRAVEMYLLRAKAVREWQAEEAKRDRRR
jgi:hypothetical protein